MQILELILGFINKHFDALMVFLYVKKAAEVDKLEVERDLFKKEVEVETKEEKLKKQAADTESKVLAFKKRVDTFKKQ
jgi:hypothetical protein